MKKPTRNLLLICLILLTSALIFAVIIIHNNPQTPNTTVGNLTESITPDSTQTQEFDNTKTPESDTTIIPVTDETKAPETDVHTHVFGTEWEIDGVSHWHICDCGEKSDVTVHTYGKWTVTREATEDMEGLKERLCTVCGYKETEVIPTLNHVHDFGTIWQKNETSHWHVCKCGDNSDLVDHSYSEWKVTIEATVDSEGSKERVCSVCEYKDITTIPVLSHVHKFETTWEKNETSHWHICDCGEKSDLNTHTYSEWTVTQAATCTENGQKERTCTACGQTESGTVLKTEHSIVKDDAVEPTCTVEGKTKGSHCSECGMVFKAQISIEATGHSWTEYTKTIKTNTCEDDGVELHFCKCGESITSIIEATGHAFGEYTITKKPTCQNEGVQSATCTLCGNTLTQPIERTEHNYQKTDNITDGKVEYSCTICYDSYVFEEDNEESYTVSDLYYSDCPTDFTFKIICDEDESYIKEHLFITDAYFYNSDNNHNIDYTLSKMSSNTWKVSPVDPYVNGNTYIAYRSGNILFENNSVRNLTFSIFCEDSNVIEISDDVIFLKKLDNQFGGYYPYSIDYSENSESYWVTLNKVDGLKVGDIICIGESATFDELLKADSGNDQFGEIAEINYLSEQNKYLIKMVQPDLAELFEKLNIHISKIESETGLMFVESDELLNQAKAALYESEDFLEFIAATQYTAEEYLSSRGLSTPLKTLKDFIKSIKIDKENCQEPTFVNGAITAKIQFTGRISIPVTLTDDPDSKKVGNISISFTAYVVLDSLTIDIQLEKQTINMGEEDIVVKFKMGVEQIITAGFNFSVETNVDYSADAKPYILNSESRIYHYRDCKHVQMIKDKTKLQKLTAVELFEFLANGTITVENECNTCMPVSAMMTDNYVLNITQKTVHQYNCSSLKNATSSTLAISTQSLGNLIVSGYTECGTCHPSQRHTNNFSEQLLKNIKYQDFGTSIDELKSLTGSLNTGSTGSDIEFAKIDFTIAGVGEVTLSLSIYFDFKLEASLEYEYKVQNATQYGVILTEKGFEAYNHTDNSTLANKITMSGKTRVDVGLIAGIDFHVKGVDKFFFVKLDGKIGLYAKVHGALQLDFIDNSNNYAAAYFESGIHLDVLVSAKFAVWETLDKSILPDNMKDHPFYRCGYEKAYYNYDNVPDILEIDTIFYNLENANLLNVKYFDLLNMKEGVESLNVMGLRDKYSVEFYLKNGTNCSITDGYLLINNYNNAFEDELTIIVKGYDTWSNYRKGNSKYDLDIYTVTIKYTPSDKEVDVNEDKNVFIDVGAGSHHTVGLKSDGTVVATGHNEMGQCDVYEWTDIVSIAVGKWHTVGLRANGTVVAVGENYSGQCNVDAWNDIVAIAAAGNHTVGLKRNGTVVAVGDNPFGECNVSEWNNIVAISAGSMYTVGLKSDGTVVATGDGSFGRCNVDDWTNIVSVSAGYFHTIGWREDGTFVATGYYVEEFYSSEWADIVSIYPGRCCTIGVKSDGSIVYSVYAERFNYDISYLRDLSFISVGFMHIIGIKNDGTVISDGQNVYDCCEVDNWNHGSSNKEPTIEERYNSLIGNYQGWYTATQGITGVKVGIHRTNALLNDSEMLMEYAELATLCSRNSNGEVQKTYTVDDIIQIIEHHEDEYIAIFMFGPLRENPNVEDGMYTMDISYDAQNKTFNFTGSEWIQHDTYDFADCLNIRQEEGNLFGDIYGKKANWFWVTYADLGDIYLAK